MRRSKGWGGNGTVEVYRECVVHPETGALFPVDDGPEGSDEWETMEVTFTFEGSGHHTPGCFHRAPEDCYPDDENFEITGWTCSHVGLEPTSAEEDDALDKLREEISQQDDGPDPDDYYDRKREQEYGLDY